MPAIPEGRFVIAGRNPAPAVLKLASERVYVTGAVGDMRSWLAAADIVVAPLRIARGIQNKVLEAMAMGKAVVATDAAFEGIEAQAQRDLIVVNDSAQMARTITSLLNSPGRAAQLGRAARQRMVEGYSWDKRLVVLDEILFPANEQAAA
jgi:glycosyltransferase involved in cell wall biosynthesis